MSSGVRDLGGWTTLVTHNLWTYLVHRSRRGQDWTRDTVSHTLIHSVLTTCLNPDMASHKAIVVSAKIYAGITLTQ